MQARKRHTNISIAILHQERDSAAFSGSGNGIPYTSGSLQGRPRSKNVVHKMPITKAMRRRRMHDGRGRRIMVGEGAEEREVWEGGGVGGEGTNWICIEMQMQMIAKMKTRNATGDAGERHSCCVGLSACAESIVRLLCHRKIPSPLMPATTRQTHTRHTYTYTHKERDTQRE